MWKLEDQEWFIYYREERWRIGDKSDNGRLRSQETGTEQVPETSWEYWAWLSRKSVAFSWNSGAGITVKGGYTGIELHVTDEFSILQKQLRPPIVNY